MPVWLIYVLVIEGMFNLMWFILVSYDSFSCGDDEGFLVSPRSIAYNLDINLFGGMCIFFLYFLIFPIYIVVVWTFILLYRLLYWLFHIGVDK